MKIKSMFPILDWLPNYNKAYLKGDINAGITVGILLIPQGMAYAMLAGLPPIYGLYTAIVPSLIYAIFGTSRQLGVGPVAMDSLLVAVSISQFSQVGSEQYIQLAILLAFIVGGIQFILGILRLGILVNFLSHPVISGFTSAAAIIIGVSQLKHLLGIELAQSTFLYDTLLAAYQQLGNSNPYTLLLGISGIVILLFSKKYIPNIPAPLIVVVAGVLAVWGFELEQYSVAIAQEIPSQLPQPVLPVFNWSTIQQLLPSALTIALVAFMEAIAVAKAIHPRHNDYQIDPNQELIALGLANFVGAIFQSFPGTGGFSRSAVNDQAGAKTNLAAIISALFIVVTLLFLTPLFYYLPKAILASIIMVAVAKLISIKDAMELWQKGYKREWFILVITFLLTLTFGIQKGILTGVFLSIIGTLYDSLHPTITLLHQEDANRLIIQLEGQLYFGNSSYFKEMMEHILVEQLSLDFPPTHYVLDGRNIPKIDSTGEKALLQVLDFYQKKGISLQLTELPSTRITTNFSNLQNAITKK